MMRGCILALLVSSIVLPIRAAHADQIGKHVTQLRQSRHYRLRLSAVLHLSRSKDSRAIRAVAEALRSDKKANIRSVAAVSLGKMIDRRTSPPDREIATRSLKVALRRDSASRVRADAAKSLKRVAKSKPPPPKRKKGLVFLNVGQANDSTRQLSSRTKGQLRGAVQSTLSKHAPTYSIGSAPSELPTEQELDRSGMMGFYIGAAVASLSVRKMGRQAEVRCSVSVRVSPWTGRDGHEKIVAHSSASAKGSARVIGSSSQPGISASKKECVIAVAEEVTARQVVPFLKRTAR